MSKEKLPLLSLAATGTIGDKLTYTTRAGVHIAKTKPVPSYRRTLYQLYQRWDYQFYSTWWGSLSAAEKATYRTLGVPHHRTAFQQWMSYALTNLPGLVGRWRLDSIITNQARDSSPSGINGTVFGCTSIPAVVDHGYHFDGIDNRVLIGTSSVYRFTASFTLFTRFFSTHTAAHQELFSSQSGASNGYTLYYTTPGGWLRWEIAGLTPFGVAYAQAPINQWQDTAITYDHLNHKIDAYLNGLLILSTPVTGTPVAATRPLYLGIYSNAVSHPLSGGMDGCHIFNDVIPPECHLKLHERSYP